MGILEHLSAIDAHLDEREARERDELLFTLGADPAVAQTAEPGAAPGGMIPWSPGAPEAEGRDTTGPGGTADAPDTYAGPDAPAPHPHG